MSKRRNRSRWQTATSSRRRGVPSGERRSCRWILPAIAAAVLVVAVAWLLTRPATDSTDVADDPAAANEQPLREDGAVDLDAIGLVSPTLHVEPDKRGWESEAFNDAAAAQLKKVGKWLTAGHPPVGGEASRLVTGDFRCGRLRPADLATVLDDPSLTVHRAAAAPASDRHPSPPAAYQGAAGFAEALRDLREPLAAAAGVRSKFKIYHVSVAADGATTDVIVELAGRNSLGDYQQKATWKCNWQLSPDAPPRLAGIELMDFEQAQAKSPRRPLFADCTEAVLGGSTAYREQLAHGIDHWLGRIEDRFGLTASGWEGIAVGDVNGDGLDDLYVCQPGGLSNRLFLQTGDGRAVDISAAAGVDWWDHTNAALLVDLDGDGDQDLALALTLGLLVMSNNGQGQFSVAAAHLIPEAIPFSLAAADFDNDGDLDLYACCYSQRRVGARRRRMLGRPIPYHDANNGGRNVLLRNDRNWRFTDVTRQVGLDQNNRRFSLAAAWEDYDDDGDVDLYVANDYGRNNLYRNDGGHFTDVAAAAGVEDISAGMSVSWGDYNADGRMDLYVSNMWSSAGNRVTYQRQFQPGVGTSVRGQLQRHARGNSLFMNLGDGTFRDVSVASGVTLGRWAWGSRFFDLNNDGRQDIVVANGFITQEDPGDL